MPSLSDHHHPDIATLLTVAHRMADAAREETSPRFRARHLGAENKAEPGAFDPVTEADRASEEAMRRVLAEHRPDDGIYGEEQARTHGRSGFTWVIDPIDGTRSFISGLPVWGTLIALDDGSAGILGIIDQPYLDERYVGGPDGAVLIRGGAETPLATRPCEGLATATLFTTDADLFSAPERAAFDQVRKTAQLTRYGVDCYAYALLASGHIDLVIESGLQPYDVAALVPVVRAAGGVITDWAGGDPRWGGQVVAAGSSAVHEEALAHLRSAAQKP